MFSSISSQSLEEFRKELLKLHNDYRATKGRPPLVIDPILEKAAQDFAEYSVKTGQYSHTAGGTQPKDRVQKAADQLGKPNIFIHWSHPDLPKDKFNVVVGENIGQGWDTTQGVFKSWQDSPGHNSNILRGDNGPQPGPNRVGFGYYNGQIKGKDFVPGKTIWVTMFGASCDRTLTEAFLEKKMNACMSQGSAPNATENKAADIKNSTNTTNEPKRVSSGEFILELVSGGDQTYSGGGMPKPMVFKIKNNKTGAYIANLSQNDLSMEMISDNSSGKADGTFNNLNDACKNGSKECFGGYYYISSNRGKAPFTLAVTVQLKKGGKLIDSYVVKQSIKD